MYWWRKHAIYYGQDGSCRQKLFSYPQYFNHNTFNKYYVIAFISITKHFRVIYSFQYIHKVINCPHSSYVGVFRNNYLFKYKRMYLFSKTKCTPITKF